MDGRIRASWLVIGIVLLASVAAFAVTVRKASQNGTNSSQPQMDLFGPTQPNVTDGGKLGLATQVICPNQDVAGASAFDSTVFPGDTDSFKKSGHCLSGVTKFLFQIRPITKLASLTVILNKLVGFVPGTDPSVNPNNPTFGVQICDDGGNTLELCTNLPETSLPPIATRINATNTEVVFTVTNIGAGTFPQGVDYEGKGLTFFVIVQQDSETPIAVPQIAFK